MLQHKAQIGICHADRSILYGQGGTPDGGSSPPAVHNGSHKGCCEQTVGGPPSGRMLYSCTRPHVTGKRGGEGCGGWEQCVGGKGGGGRGVERARVCV